MTRRRSRRIIDDRGGEFGPRTPTEQRSREEVTPTTQVKIPRAQAFWVALPFSIAVVVSLLSPIALGPRIFWVVTGMCALAAFLWSVQFETDWQDRVSLPILVGVVAACFWKFADFAGWRVPETWQPWAALWTVFALVFWWSFVGALWLTFMQRLAMPMIPQQFHVWKALGNALEKILFGLYLDRTKGDISDRQPLPKDPQPRELNVEFREPTGHALHNRVPPLDEETCIDICQLLVDGTTYSEANMCGPDKPLPGGQRGRDTLSAMREWMIEYALLRWNRTNGDGEPITTQGVALTARGLDWCAAVLAPPPHPDEIDE